MITKILNIGIIESLDIEDKSRVKMLNIATLVALIVTYLFVLDHLFFTEKTKLAFIYFCLSFILPPVFYFNFKNKYLAARVTLFLFLYSLIFLVSMFLLVGHGNEYYYITISILVLVLSRNTYWSFILIMLNLFLFILPHYYYPNIQEEYIYTTHLAVFCTSLLAVLFFVNTQNKFKVKLKEQKAYLENLNNEKNDLMSVVAHDLKSPLAQIQGLISILKIDNSQLNAEQFQLIEKIKEVTDVQHAQITNFLNIKAVEDSIEKLELENVSVNKTLDIVLTEMKPLALAKNISITNKYNGEELIVLGSKEPLAKIISNLISNSIKFSLPNTSIQLNAESKQNAVFVTVKDEGQGFTEEDKLLVFKKNQVLSAKPTANESSSGVGLYIIKKYVERMNGMVWLESEAGKGTTFFIKFPLVKE